MTNSKKINNEKLKEETIKNIERVTGLSIDKVRQLTIEEEQQLVLKKCEKTLSFPVTPKKPIK